MYNAASNPDHHVMMLDFSETGDVSTLALGGFIGTSELGSKGKATADAYFSKSMATTDTLAAAAAAGLRSKCQVAAERYLLPVTSPKLHGFRARFRHGATVPRRQAGGDKAARDRLKKLGYFHRY